MSEGALSFAIREILYYFVFVAEKKLDLDIFNDRLSTFNHTGNGFTNKPPLITTDEVKNKKISFSASERLTFTLILPMLMGDLVDTDDDVWQYFLCLREIVDIVFARELQTECCALLETLVCEHHEMFIKLFKCSLKPKQHNMTHYGTIMKMCGPLSALSTIRNESKHKFMKDVANSTSSRKQITYTIALKQQLNFYHRTVSNNSGLVSNFQIGPTSVPSKTLIRKIFNAFNILQFSDDESIIEATWVNVNGIRYIVGTCVFIRMNEKDIPVFGVIDNILLNNKQSVGLHCKILETHFYEEHLHAFEVRSTKNAEFINVENLSSVFPSVLHRMSNDTLYVTLKNY